MRAIVGIDVGGSSMRGVLFDLEGRKKESVQVHYAPDFPEPGHSEQDARTWIRHLEDILRALASKGDYRVECLVLTAARSSVIPVDRDGEPLAPAMMWQDRRSVSIVDAYRDSHAFIYERTGMRFTTIASAPRILWIKQHRPELYRKSRYFFGIQDFLVHRLTGEAVTDHSFGSRTAIMHLEEKRWDDELLRLYGIEEEKLCRLIRPGSVCGTLSQACAARVGIPSGTPVVTAGGDQQCAALGQGVFTATEMLVNTGTGGYLVQGLDTPIVDEAARFVCNASAIPGAYILEASVPTAGAVYRWFAELFFPEEGGARYDRVNEAAGRSPLGARGVLVLPCFEGRGAPYWEPRASGAFLNLSLGTGAGDMARAVLEGIALELAENKAAMEVLAGTASDVKSTGGMAEMPLYNRILADCFGVPVSCPDERESTLQGVWIAGALAIGAHSSYKSAYDLCQGRGCVYRADGKRHRAYMEILDIRKAYYEEARRNDFFQTKNFLFD